MVEWVPFGSRCTGSAGVPLNATGTSTTIAYRIDGLGRRIERKTSVTVQRFLYGNGMVPLAELDGSNGVVSQFVYGSRWHVPDHMIKGGQKYRILAEQLGSVRLVVDASKAAP